MCHSKKQRMCTFRSVLCSYCSSTCAHRGLCRSWWEEGECLGCAMCSLKSSPRPPRSTRPPSHAISVQGISKVWLWVWTSCHWRAGVTTTFSPIMSHSFSEVLGWRGPPPAGYVNEMRATGDGHYQKRSCSSNLEETFRQYLLMNVRGCSKSLANNTWRSAQEVIENKIVWKHVKIRLRQKVEENNTPCL